MKLLLLRRNQKKISKINIEPEIHDVSGEVFQLIENYQDQLMIIMFIGSKNELLKVKCTKAAQKNIRKYEGS